MALKLINIISIKLINIYMSDWICSQTVDVKVPAASGLALHIYNVFYFWILSLMTMPHKSFNILISIGFWIWTGFSRYKFRFLFTIITFSTLFLSFNTFRALFFLFLWFLFWKKPFHFFSCFLCYIHCPYFSKSTGFYNICLCRFLTLM